MYDFLREMYTIHIYPKFIKWWHIASKGACHLYWGYMCSYELCNENFMEKREPAVSEFLRHCVPLTWLWPCEGSQHLRPMGNGNTFFGSRLRNTQLFLLVWIWISIVWAEQKMLTIAFSLWMLLGRRSIYYKDISY